MSNRTATIHSITGSNDILSDTGWSDISLFVAIDHENEQVVDADIRDDLLERRLRRDGWDVVIPLATFVHNGDRWVAMKETN